MLTMDLFEMHFIGLRSSQLQLIEDAACLARIRSAMDKKLPLVLESVGNEE